MSKRVLLSFIGGQDITPGNISNHEEKPSAIIQLLKYIKPQEIHLFITKGLKEKYVSSGLKDLIITLFPDIKLIETYKDNIIDPTDPQKIYEAIYEDLKALDQYVCEGRHQAFVNLTSGTPQIIAVLSTCLVLDLISRSHGVYAPNPEYSKDIRINDLEFFKNSLGIHTFTTLVDNYDYHGISSLFKDKHFTDRINKDKELFTIVEFAKNRFTSNFEEAQKYYQLSSWLKKAFPDYKPSDGLDLAIERFYTIQPLLQNNEDSVAIIWLATIRETILEFLPSIVLKENWEKIFNNTNNDKRLKFNLEMCHKIYPDLIQSVSGYFDEEIDEEKAKFDPNREINQNTLKYVLRYLATKNKEKHLENVVNKIKPLDSLMGVRNKVAHTIISKKVENNWHKITKQLLQEAAKICDKPFTEENPYDVLNEEIQIRLEKVFSS